MSNPPPIREADHFTAQTQRRRIAEATCRLVAEHGIEGASLRRVARELGGTTGLVTHYYPTKDALLEAALETALANLARSYPDDHQRPESMDEWVEQFLAALPSDEVRQTFWRVLAAFQSASMNTPRLAEAARRQGHRNKPDLARLVAMTLPTAGAERVEELTEALWLVVDGIGVSASLHGAQISQDNLRKILRGAWRSLLGIHTTQDGENR